MKRVRKLLIGVSVVVALIIGFGVGSLGKKEANKEVEKPKVSETKPTTLTEERVKQFLIAYYTKKDLSENRNRYKPMMTEAMYKQETNQEDLPVNQAYKGYTVNQVFDSAKIYVDDTNLTAICEVTYHNTQLKEKNSIKNALKDQSNTESIKISYIKQGNDYLVNNINGVMLTDMGSTGTQNNFNETESSEE
ncbi:hypothetical protein EA794_07235 [Lactococcus petauri]|uniref:hypothetical protein n=1 Tax=Lactococcus petauri TaxID=1940789 RepID=UPI0013FE13FD|nr:hypothetical protein [Lactococcus petauri]MDC0826541.1 hypothetical protein [Lactococcus petauri]NHI75766.1 hypothetical protein [Lactococcus petauri]